MTHPVTTKSRIRTEGGTGYSDAALEEYRHHVWSAGAPPRTHTRVPHIHNVFGNLTTWLNGTHHGGEPTYLPSYLDECVFRVTRRQSPMAAVQTLRGIALQKNPQTLENLRG